MKDRIICFSCKQLIHKSFRWCDQDFCNMECANEYGKNVILGKEIYVNKHEHEFKCLCGDYKK